MNTCCAIYPSGVCARFSKLGTLTKEGPTRGTNLRQISFGDDDGDLEQGVGLGVEARHLAVDPDDSFRVGREELGRGTGSLKF